MLEDKYGVLEVFCNNYESNIEQYVVELIQDELAWNRTTDKQLQSYVQQLWREYIINSEWGRTEASAARDDPAFVDTSSYYLGMTPQIILTDTEKKAFKWQ